MRNWLIPAIALLAINLAGIGVGWSVNEWQGGGETPAAGEEAAAPAQTGPTEAELDAQRCNAALGALGNLDPGVAVRGLPQYQAIQDAIDRYCH